MSYSFISSTTAQASPTGAIDTTGADLLVGMVVWAFNASPPDFADSKFNIWELVESEAVNVCRCAMLICTNPTVGSGHTFSSSSTLPQPAAQAFSLGSESAVDQSNSASGSASTIKPGSVTPLEDNELVATACGGGNGSQSVSSGWNEPDGTVTNGYFQSQMVYKIQTSAGTEDPTWTVNGAAFGNAAVIATFKAAGGGGISADLPTGLLEFAGVAPATAKSAGLLVGLLKLTGVAQTAKHAAALPPAVVHFVGVSMLDGDLLSASFTAGNGTSLDAYTPERGPVAVEEQGNWDIQNGAARLTVTAGDNQNIAVWYLPSGHVRLRTRIALPASDYDVGVVFNVLDNINYWLFWINKPGGLTLYKRIAGIFTSVATDAFVPTQGTTIEVDVLADGDDVELSIDSTLYISYSVSSRPLADETGVGPRNFGDTNVATFDNFSATGLVNVILVDVPVSLIEFIGVNLAAKHSATVLSGLIKFTGLAPIVGNIADVPAVSVEFLGIAPNTLRHAAIASSLVKLVPTQLGASKHATLPPSVLELVSISPTVSRPIAVAVGLMELVPAAMTAVKGARLTPVAVEFVGVEPTTTGGITGVPKFPGGADIHMAYGSPESTTLIVSGSSPDLAYFYKRDS